MININLDKAREIHRQRIRRARKSLLEQLDVAFVRALETGQDTAAIAAQKQALRDATASPAIAASTTTDELKAAWNDDLLGPAPYAANEGQP